MLRANALEIRRLLDKMQINLLLCSVCTILRANTLEIRRLLDKMQINLLLCSVCTNFALVLLNKDSWSYNVHNAPR